MRALVRRFFFHVVGKGDQTLAWFDKWHDEGPLGSIVTCRDIYRGGFMLGNKVMDLIHDDQWAWPIEWNQKYPILNSLAPLVLNDAEDNDRVSQLVHNPLRRLYYCKVGTPLILGIKEIKNDDDVEAFLIVGYETKWVVDMYAEHLDDDAFDVRDFAETNNVDLGNESSDAYCSSDEEDYGDVEFFFTESDENVQIRVVTRKDPFLLKLCSNSGHYKGFIDEKVNEPTIEVINDTDNIDPKYRAKAGIIYPRHDPTQQWDKMEPVLRMRFETNEQLKLALANYGVAKGYQLWFMRNDWKQLLVYCGRDVQSGRCAGAPTIKKRQQDRNKKNCEGSSKDGEGCSTIVVGCSNDGEGISKSPNRSRIKSLKPKHRCSRNYNLGSLVTYKWMAHHYAKELIADPFIPLLKMKADIRARYHLNVSIGQCLRAKQRALFDYEGGLKEHYARIWEYRNVVLDTNPEIINIPSDSSDSMFGFSSDSSDATNVAQQVSWEDYFPKYVINAEDCFPQVSKKMGSNTNLTSKEEAKKEFQARLKVLGVPCNKKCGEYGVKPFVLKDPKDPKGKAKKKMG
ncbi:hypothetical protein CTI12_AA102080 [Artemisia annua]|uniref:Uncharacterized protein n=1 Tax=Artemisia annua TaxID=35608 RepID=A0A2U1NX14_ARTAN|nr:hypothetical protein CTI12_AA102080 [Artemisia annua]